MKTRVDSPTRYRTNGGRTIYAICTEVFPNFFGNQYIVEDGSHRVLVDTGSALESSQQNLRDGLASIEATFGERIGFADLDAVLITHGHMDHFGGLAAIRAEAEMPVAIHPLDRRVLTQYEERVAQTTHALRRFLVRSGIDGDALGQLMEMYHFPKKRHHSTTVEFLLEEGKPVLMPTRDGGSVDLEIDVLHTPGHCPGQVCLRIDDVLLTADHVLARITPHQSPESVTLHTGLWHYLEALDKVQRYAARHDVRTGLGGHEKPMRDVVGRVDQIRGSHQRRLDKVRSLCAEPATLADISNGLFGRLKNYDVLLALEEAGAHVEYLELVGELGIANLEDVQADADVVPLYFAR